MAGSKDRVLRCALALAVAWPSACADPDGDSTDSSGAGRGGSSAGESGSGGLAVNYGGTSAHVEVAGAGGGAGFNEGSLNAAGRHGSGGAAGITGGAAGITGGAAGIGGAAGAGHISIGSGGVLIVLEPPILHCPGGASSGGAGGAVSEPSGSGGTARDPNGSGSVAAASSGFGGGGSPEDFRGAQEDGARATFTVTDLGSKTEPVAINEPGQVLGVVSNSTTSGRACRSFLLDTAGVREIVVNGGYACTLVYDLNDAGLVVGSVGEPSRPFLWQDGAATFLNEVSGTPVAVNNLGQVVFDSGLLWQAGIVTPLEIPDGRTLIPVALNNLGQIVGTPASSREAYLWHAGTAVELPLVEPKAINDHGHVVGVQGQWVGIWNGSVFARHASISDVDATRRLALNNFDQLVGTRDESPGDWPPSPFVGTLSHFTRLEYAGEAYDLNDRGDLIGRRFWYMFRGPSRDAILTVGPGPGRIWSRSCSLACCL